MTDKPLINPQDELTIAVLARSINLLDDRLAALENAHDTRRWQFTPGWIENKGKNFNCGIEQLSLVFYHTIGEQTVTLAVTSKDDEDYVEVELSIRGLSQFIGAALEIFKRMEAGNANVSG